MPRHERPLGAGGGGFDGARILGVASVLVGVLLTLWTGEAVAGDPRDGEQLWAMAALQGGFGFLNPKLDRVKGFTLQSRTRLEQRIIQENVGWRLREFVKGTVNVPGSDRIYLAAYDELFFDLDDTTWSVGGQRSGFRQNRAFAGLGFRLDPGKHISFEAGYLNQWFDRRKEDRMNHVLSLNLFLNY